MACSISKHLCCPDGMRLCENYFAWSMERLVSDYLWAANYPEESTDAEMKDCVKGCEEGLKNCDCEAHLPFVCRDHDMVLPEHEIHPVTEDDVHPVTSMPEAERRMRRRMRRMRRMRRRN